MLPAREHEIIFGHFTRRCLIKSKKDFVFAAHLILRHLLCLDFTVTEVFITEWNLLDGEYLVYYRR